MLVCQKGKGMKTEAIIQAVCKYFKYTKTELINPNKTYHLCYARAVCAWLLYTYDHQSHADVGKILGNRDHSTIIKAVRNIQQDIEHCQNDIDHIKAMIQVQNLI